MKRVGKATLMDALPVKARVLVLRQEITVVHPAGPIVKGEQTRPEGGEIAQGLRTVAR